MKSLFDNNTYGLGKLLKGREILKNKWVYFLKTKENNSQLWHKDTLVMKGFNQKKCVDFSEIFSRVVKIPSIRIVLSMSANMDLEIEQMDVKTAFLHGAPEEKIYL